MFNKDVAYIQRSPKEKSFSSEENIKNNICNNEGFNALNMKSKNKLMKNKKYLK